MKKYWVLFSCLSFSFLLAAQDDSSKRWTLEVCLQHAIANNIDIQSKIKQTETAEVDLSSAQKGWLPNLNAGVGQNFDFGRSPSTSGLYIDRTSSNTILNINSSMPVFDGLKTPYDIKAKDFNLKAAVENLNKAKEDLSINIASYFLSVLMNKELQKVNQLQVDLSTQEVERTSIMVEAGKVPLSQLYDIKAQQAKDEVSLTEARNTTGLSLIQLAQVLELEKSGHDFDIAPPIIEDDLSVYMKGISSADDIYNHAVGIKPHIKGEEYLLESYKYKKKVAEAGYYPKLNLDLNYSNGYYYYFNSTERENASFANQMRDNNRGTIGLSLSIPIFNRFQVRNSVKSSQIAIENQALMIQNARKVLYKEIQEAYFKALASLDKYKSAEKSVDASKLAFEMMQVRYEEGKASVFEFNESKTKYMQSLASLTQSKFEFIFRAKILDFYNGKEIRL